jgi:hypothetical protein
MSSALALIHGVVCIAPVTRQGMNGKPYSFVMVRCWTGSENQFWKVLAYLDRERATLDQLREGDGLAARGQMHVEIFDNDDGIGPRVSLSLMADHILPLRADAIDAGRTRPRRMQTMRSR